MNKCFQVVVMQSKKDKLYPCLICNNGKARVIVSYDFNVIARVLNCPYDDLYERVVVSSPGFVLKEFIID